MAGFVLVSLAALLALSVLRVIERGKVVQTSLPVDRTGTFWLQPLEDAEDPADLVNCEVPPWAWLDQDWAARMDAANHRDDRDERWTALQEAHEAVFAALQRPIAEVGLEDWNAAYYDAKALCDAARDGWHWSCEQGGFAMRA
jgi:hypothetical protein